MSKISRSLPQRCARALAVTVAILAMELVRQTTYVHAWFDEELGEVGFENFPDSPFDTPAGVGNLWLVATAACFLIVSDLYRNSFGASWSSVLRAATLTWFATFGISWVSFWMCGLVHVELVAAALAGCWVESLLVAYLAVHWPTVVTVGRAAE